MKEMLELEPEGGVIAQLQKAERLWKGAEGGNVGIRQRCYRRKGPPQVMLFRDTRRRRRIADVPPLLWPIVNLGLHRSARERG